MNIEIPTVAAVRAWFEATRGFRLRPEVTRISRHELNDAAESESPTKFDGRCAVCWRSGRHDVLAHAQRWERQGQP